MNYITLINLHWTVRWPKNWHPLQSLHMRGQQGQSCIRVGEDRQLAWPISSPDSFEPTTDLAGTLWTENSFPGAVPKGAHQREHNKSPPSDTAIMEPLVANFIFLFLLQKPLTLQFHQNAKACQPLQGRWGGGVQVFRRRHTRKQSAFCRAASRPQGRTEKSQAAGMGV